MADHIQYDFLYDNHFAWLKDAELLQGRLNLAQLAEPYVGKYYSQDYIRRKVLRQTDQEILDQDTLIEKEITDGVIPDPNSFRDPTMDQAPGGAPEASVYQMQRSPTTPKDPEVSGPSGDEGVI